MFDLVLSYILVFSLFACVISKDIELTLQIPWPSGILMDRVEHPQTGGIYRFGRLQYSMISTRPEWSDIYTLENIFSNEECREYIDKTESYASVHGWSKARHVDYAVRPTKDLPVRSLFETEEAYQVLIDKFKSQIFPYFERFFPGVHRNLFTINDLFITKYSSNSNQNALGPHKDKNPFSFVIGLNDDFEGGGTFFVDHKAVWRPPKGSALLFHAYQFHGAYPISNSSRYILAGFCEYGDESYESFKSLYQPIYDGYAAEAGFRTGDLITGIEVCFIDNQTKEIIKEMREVTLLTSDELWLEYAQSCERLTPGAPTVLRVKRFVPE